MWKKNTNADLDASFTSIKHCWGGVLLLNNQQLSLSKRDAYMRHIDLPHLVDNKFQLAYHDTHDPVGDKALLKSKGWSFVNPWEIASTPNDCQNYIQRSKAEISCPKPIFRELNTGWFSDRSVCYLAAGRPVLAEDTGFSDFMPTDKGLLAFRDLEEAVAGVNEINANYQNHAKAARNLAEEVFNSEGLCCNGLIF